MKPRYANIFQSALEISIPLLGYFLWSWTLHFIVFFIIIDVISQVGITISKDKKIRYYHSKSFSSFKQIAIYFLLIVSIIFLLLMLTKVVFPNNSIYKELISFLTYKEFGIPQGVIIVPLIVFSGIQDFKLNFIQKGIFRTLSIEKMWKIEIFKQMLFTSVLILTILVSIYFHIYEWSLILIIVAFYPIFRFYRL
jgi:hypothetical protein